MNSEMSSRDKTRTSLRMGGTNKINKDKKIHSRTNLKTSGKAAISLQRVVQGIHRLADFIRSGATKSSISNLTALSRPKGYWK